MVESSRIVFPAARQDVDVLVGGDAPPEVIAELATSAAVFGSVAAVLMRQGRVLFEIIGVDCVARFIASGE